ncbi:RNA polymerase sigma factor SigJ (plasmid) [Tsukamurella tyrosinosolvens]|uniref:RNA polymerase sigma-70 factor, ECF subfamily n=1 Tax=Tsukamurella tyrosinosolvens TaxID=57704 RepID=A0A1H4NV33_TSUTY|nr:sigma-70 family RNA polymerase sigma factor [Tsukamurella tyrosinosolvens]KXO97225.1 hypothetical protein AXK58_08270 [Tsukamurella tyrosinosolvens]SEB99083.1 RNA polymerase sigma-70 factor, ECF subfamily [Tsukamurella tyrosinosolvens]VEI00006.1 RNA polymerase sigma factor SigJ [Tsukamurella tyrosinosolvens]
MDADAELAAHFESSRTRLTALAARILLDRSAAEDVVQEAWVRLSRPGATELGTIVNLDGWMTTVVVRTSLNALRARSARPEDLVGGFGEDLAIRHEGSASPEDHAVIAEQVAFALELVLRTLTPPERVAFVLHDSFGVPFGDIAELLDRSVDATRKLASRARSQVHALDASELETNPAARRSVVDAFFGAAARGDLAALVEVLHPEVTFHADGGTSRPDMNANLQGRGAVSRRAAAFAVPDAQLEAVVINGCCGVVVRRNAVPLAAMAFTVLGGRIFQIYSLLDAVRVAELVATLPHDHRS